MKTLAIVTFVFKFEVVFECHSTEHSNSPAFTETNLGGQGAMSPASQKSIRCFVWSCLGKKVFLNTS